MGRIRWREEMAVDHGVIDDDHRHLIDLINRFRHPDASGSGFADAVDVLNALKFYADTHFSREERLQRLADYPVAPAHRAQHRELMATLEEIIARARSITAGSAPEIVDELGTLLRHWLLDHMIMEDLRMKPYAHLMKGHAGALPALKHVTPEGR